MLSPDELARIDATRMRQMQDDLSAKVRKDTIAEWFHLLATREDLDGAECWIEASEVVMDAAILKTLGIAPL